MLQNKLQVFVASFTAALVTVVLTYGTTFPRMYFKRNIHSRFANQYSRTANMWNSLKRINLLSIIILIF